MNGAVGTEIRARVFALGGNRVRAVDPAAGLESGGDAAGGDARAGEAVAPPRDRAGPGRAEPQP